MVEADAAAPRICLNFSDQLAETAATSPISSPSKAATNLAVEAERPADLHRRRRARPPLPRDRARGAARRRRRDAAEERRARHLRARPRALRRASSATPMSCRPAASRRSRSSPSTPARVERQALPHRRPQLAGAIADGKFLSQLSLVGDGRDRDADRREGVGGRGRRLERDQQARSRRPFPSANCERSSKPGAYILTAEAVNNADEWTPKATQWFIVTDLGLTTLSGNDGLHAMVRSLGTAGPVGGVRLRLVAVNNEVLGEATTDAEGYANFAPGLMRGTGGMAPGPAGRARQMPATTASSTCPSAAMDLTDRGVEGREPPKPLDVFLTTERGIYRVGETVYATALVRDATANAVTDVPLTAIVTRPDGKEDSRVTLQDQGLGGTRDAGRISPPTPCAAPGGSASMPTSKGQPLAETTFLVEDFEPERLDFDLETTATSIDRNAPAPLDHRRALPLRRAGRQPQHRRRGGAEGGTRARRLSRLRVRPCGRDIRHRGRAVLRHRDGRGRPRRDPGRAPRCGADQPAADRGRSTSACSIRAAGRSSVPRRCRWPTARGRVGIRPLFDGAAAENGPAAFEVIALDTNGARSAAQGLDWSLYEVRDGLPVVPHRRPLGLRDRGDEEPRRQRHDRYLRRQAGPRRSQCANGAPTVSR